MSPGSMPLATYPWDALPRVPRRALKALARARAAWSSVFDPGKLAAALEALLETKVLLDLGAFEVGPPAVRFPEVTLRAGDALVTLGLEPDLVPALLMRVLGRPFALSEPSAALPPAVAGALAALCVEVARRVADGPVMLETAPADPTALRAHATLSFEGRAYAGYALVVAPFAGPDTARPPLLALGDIPLSVPLVVMTSLVTRAELAQLVPGAALLPSESFIDAHGVGRGVLIGPRSERGVWVEVPADGRIVLGDGTAELPFDAGNEDMTPDPDDLNETLTEAALEAPVVVRVELGVVSLSARQWAELAPGDVLETGQPVGGQVLLRIGGRAVARGELVAVDGEVGVRVRELFGQASEQ